MSKTCETMKRPGGVEVPLASVKTPRRDPLSAPSGTLSSVAYDPFGEGGLYATDPRYGWRDDARCYALRCESCHHEWAVTLEVGFWVCLGCRPEVLR